MDICQLVANQRAYFETGATRSLSFRLSALTRLKQAIQANEELLVQALREDLNKPASESYLCEIGIVYDEISYHLRHLKSWVKDRRVKTPLAQFPSKSFLSPEPYGVVLIMAPWNYPMQLCFSPLVGAISAGNTAVVKPSAYAPQVSHVVAKIVAEAFPAEYIAVVEGGREENQALLQEKFDYIFFTGSPSVGKLVMRSAAEHLTPISLELGGKSPVIVDETADLRVSARRIAFGKILNAGQTCVAPDYAFVHESVMDAFVEHYRRAVEEFFPDGDFSTMPHIINRKHYRRILDLLEGEARLLDGECQEESRLIQPMLIAGRLDSPMMAEEIFGPVLPVIGYTRLEQCIDFIRSRPKPLALYLFTKSKETEKRVLSGCSFGGGCINDTVIHLATPYMGFGGVGESGMGRYHGKFSFDTFSNQRSVVKKAFWLDLPMRYRPYSQGKDGLIRKFLK